jgi:hypothetical protein
MVENVSAGAVDLHPGPVDHVDLPGGPGSYHVAVTYRDRDLAAQLRRAAEDHDDRNQRLRTLDGREQYLAQLWRIGDLPPDDDEDD